MFCTWPWHDWHVTPAFTWRMCGKRTYSGTWWMRTHGIGSLAWFEPPTEYVSSSFLISGRSRAGSLPIFGRFGPTAATLWHPRQVLVAGMRSGEHTSELQ